MNSMQQIRAICIRSPILLALVATPGVVFAEVGSGGIPENAHAKAYGSGWECDRGFREVDEICAPIKVPSNAYPTNRSYGRGWECARGYQEIDDACVAVQVPSNAYLWSSGDRWKCDRGYREVNED